MRTRWTRERVIRDILEREADGRTLTTSGEGTDHRLYCAARRIFGSWRNALLAAGIPPERVLPSERWSPARILAQIRRLSRRDRPLTTDELEHRYRNLVSSARRHFGSWSKAVIAAGVDPSKLQRVVPWTKERVIESILTRALRSDPLVARQVEPRSLVEAGQRFFGSWSAAVSAAGLNPSATKPPPRRAQPPRPGRPRVRRAASADGPAPTPWSVERVIEAILARHREQRPLNAWAVSRSHSRLYSAAKRHLGSWDEALRAAGFDPEEHRRRGRRSPAHEPGAPNSATDQSQDSGRVRHALLVLLRP